MNRLQVCPAYVPASHLHLYAAVTLFDHCYNPTMVIIPVLDLKGGQAVHAVRGKRVHYKPVRGVLGDGEDVLGLAMAYRDRLDCQTLYVADLDAIAGLPGHARLLRSLSATGLRLWVDAGVSTTEQVQALVDLGVAKVIIGSETLDSPDQLMDLVTHFPSALFVLSVDLIGGILRAPKEIPTPSDLLQLAVSHKLESVILLDLNRVGAAAGPPLDLLISLHKSFPSLSLYAGGGVRDQADLVALDQAGAAGALVATAFHQGVLSATDL
jgi:phosphoribosylformimino-5-aminoimidazole carboxamide ribotide isomerase